MKAFRQAPGQITAPICPECKVGMIWARSALLAAEQMIEHVFACPRCDEIAEIKTPVQASIE